LDLHKTETSTIIDGLRAEVIALRDKLDVRDDKISRLKAVVKELQVCPLLLILVLVMYCLVSLIGD